MSARWQVDVFCRVVDNFGDVGVCWRLARQLRHEHGLRVRLIIDDLASLTRLVPAADGVGPHDGVEVRLWSEAAVFEPADRVIEAFGCELPVPYVESMSRQTPPPCWINLEYLSAEAWVDTHHLLSSVHPRLGLRKTFFFPGFTPATGGLIRESKLSGTALAQHAMPPRILLFGYPNAAAASLVRAAAASGVAVDVPVGALADQLTREQVDFRKLDFVPQSEFDGLLSDYAMVFVRGEDSFVRAQWAARPMVWQIYPQAENAHETKLAAFLDRYCVGLADATAARLQALWWAWNRQDPAAVEAAWRALWGELPTLQAHALVWRSSLLQQGDLAGRLVTFWRETAKI